MGYCGYERPYITYDNRYIETSGICSKHCTTKTTYIKIPQLTHLLQLAPIEHEPNQPGYTAMCGYHLTQFYQDPLPEWQDLSLRA